MNRDEANIGSDKRLAFFGKMTASISHEMNNLLAIINEFAGLLDDLLKGSGGGRSIEQDKLKRVSENIHKQIQRGQSTVKRLNRFAHSVDYRVSEFDLNVLLDDTVSMGRHLATLKGTRLEARLPEESVSVISSRFDLQRVISDCIELLSAPSETDGLIAVTYQKEAHGVKICAAFSSELNRDDLLANLDVLADSAKELGGRVELVSTDQDQALLTLSLPYSIPCGQNGPDA